MLKRLLSSLLPRSSTAAAAALDATGAIATPEHFAAVPMPWRSGTTLPLPDWDRLALQEPADLTDAARHDWWTAAAAHWLLATGRELAGDYRLRSSPDFLLLSSLADRPAQVFLQFCQDVHRWIRRNLGDIASDAGHGKHAVMVFASEDDYYRYISHYYPEEGEFALSSGMFVNAGYGHFAMFEGGMAQMQPTVAHELTHCLVSHLPIPAWLNEGLATNTEAALFPQLFAPSAQLYHPNEMVRKHAAFWNADTIQEFWSGNPSCAPTKATCCPTTSPATSPGGRRAPRAASAPSCATPTSATLASAPSRGSAFASPIWPRPCSARASGRPTPRAGARAWSAGSSSSLLRNSLPGGFSSRRSGAGPYRLTTKQSLTRLLPRPGHPWPGQQAVFQQPARGQPARTHMRRTVNDHGRTGWEPRRCECQI
ncbi:MAG: hypothetical protein H4O13_03540 [Xanthomonadales bacterium]|nr:hypothetical protein [Xanthomonadales bacterium]